MGLQKKWICCRREESFSKGCSIKRKQTKSKDEFEKVINVKLIRLEDDTKIESYINQNNIKTDFKKFISSTLNKENIEDTLKRAIDKDSETDSSGFRGFGKIKIKKVSSINNSMLFDLAGANDYLKLVTKKTDDIKSSSADSNLKPSANDLTSEITFEKMKEKYFCSGPSLNEINSSNRRKNMPCPKSRRKNKTEEKTNITLSNEIAEAMLSKDIKPLKKDPANSSNITRLENKLTPEIQEPLNLITKLTGCQIPPSKVEILPLSSCLTSINNNDDDDDLSTVAQSKNMNESTTKNNCSPNITIVNGEFSHPNGHVSFEEKNKCDGDVKLSASEILDKSEEDVRTVYDVMEYISIVMPSWNLHILPDTNTFCICQVTRSKRGIPNISKCIELDDNFNGKVHIYEQHLKRFDGVYNSEDAVLALIKEVDEIR